MKYKFVWIDTEAGLQSVEGDLTLIQSMAHLIEYANMCYQVLDEEGKMMHFSIVDPQAVEFPLWCLPRDGFYVKNVGRFGIAVSIPEHDGKPANRMTFQAISSEKFLDIVKTNVFSVIWYTVEGNKILGWKSKGSEEASCDILPEGSKVFLLDGKTDPLLWTVGKADQYDD